MNSAERTPLRVAVYGRVGNFDQVALDAQVRALRTLVEGHEDWRLAGVYVDVAPSGSRMRRRKELTRMLRDCRAGKIDKILVRSVSRLSRDTQDCLELLRELIALGVTVYFELEGIDTSEDSPQMKYMGLYSMLAQREAEAATRHRSCGCCTGWPTSKERRTL